METTNTQCADKNQTSSTTNEASQEQGFFGFIFTLLFWAAIISMYLWNWDGFWQTEIKSLSNLQKKYFHTKYNEEQMKISRVAANNQLILEMEDRATRYQKIADEAERKEMSAKTELNTFINQQNERCEYYKTSLRIINNFTRSISADEINQLIRCTNKECEDIINNAPKASEICS